MVDFLSLFFCEKRDVFVIFHPKLAKKWQNCNKIQGRHRLFLLQCYSCYSSFWGIHTHFVRENNQFSYKIALFWLIFSLFICVKVEFCRNFSHKILCNLAKLSTKFRNKHRLFCCSAAVAAVHFEVIHTPFWSYLQIHIKISISNS